jgi:hypothetical protein
MDFSINLTKWHPDLLVRPALSETVKKLLFLGVAIFVSFVLAYSFIKNEMLFTGILMFISVVACLKWPFFSILLLVQLSIVQPGLFNETLEMFRPFFLISGASFLSWFLGFTNRFIRYLAKGPQSLLVFGLLFAETFGSLRVGWIVYVIETFLLWIKIFIIYFLVANLSDSFRKVRFILWATLLSSVIVALYALDLYFNAPDKLIAGRLASYGMYDNPNDLALLMVVTWPMIFKLIEIESSGLVKTFLWFTLAIITVTLLLTVSRGGILGLGAVGGLCVWSSAQIPKRIKIMILGGGLLVALVAVPVILSQRGEESGFDADDESAGHRILAWQAAGRILLAYPSGVGYGQYIEHGDSFGGPSNLQPHNTPVKVAAEGGFIGVVCYIGMLFLTLKQLLEVEHFFKKRRLYDLATITQALSIALTGFLINTSFSQKEIEWILYIVVGLSVALYNISRDILQNDAPEPI